MTKSLTHTFENSSAIAWIAWASDGGTYGTLSVKFNSGQLAKYGDVPEQVYEDMTKAESAGKYFHKCVRGVFLAI